MRRVTLDPTGCAELFIKDDGVLRDDYGGNKVRKLERVLPELARQGVRRVLTVGPAGSHHVLATTLLSRELGMSTAAVLFPQAYSEHALETLGVALELGLEPIPVRSAAGVPWALARARRAGDRLVPPGASSPSGARGYADAVAELKQQIAAGELPEPHLIVTAAGSGGTAAGLVAGVLEQQLASLVVAVDVGAAGRLAGPLIAALASEVLKREGGGRQLGRVMGRLFVARGYRGSGYARPLASLPAVLEKAREFGIEVDPTYTAKALAAALDFASEPERAARYFRLRTELSFPLRVLYWHTLSKALPARKRADPLPVELRQLFALTEQAV